MRRRSFALPALIATLSFALAPLAGAQEGKPPAAKPAPKAAPVNGAIPADVRSRVVAKLHGATPGDVAHSPIPGLYEVTMGGLIAYVSADGKYLISGNVYDLESQQNLTATRRNAARAKALAAFSESQMIVFGPPNSKMTVTVFTDIDCGFCRKFHNQIADFNKAGVRVRYMMFPRTGPGTESWEESRAGVVCHGSSRCADPLQAWRDPEEQELWRRRNQGPVRHGFRPGRRRHSGHLHPERGLHRWLLTPAELVQSVQDSDKAAATAAR
jgi:protein-disulfide isomerase